MVQSATGPMMGSTGALGRVAAHVRKASGEAVVDVISGRLLEHVDRLSGQLATASRASSSRSAGTGPSPITVP